MQKWEYLRINVRADSKERLALYLINGENVGKVSIWSGLKDAPLLDSFLAEAGEQGWELVTRSGPELLFKRPKQG